MGTAQQYSVCNLRRFKMELHERVRHARLDAGLTQEELALKTGLCVKTIINIESNLHSPRIKSLKLISEATNVSLGLLRNSPLKERVYA